MSLVNICVSVATMTRLIGWLLTMAKAGTDGDRTQKHWAAFYCAQSVLIFLFSRLVTHYGSPALDYYVISLLLFWFH